MSDREAVRVQIGQLLENALAQAGLAQAVYAYLEADFGTQTPVVMLASSTLGSMTSTPFFRPTSLTVSLNRS